jgi:bifunctional non-homologous end joining protein LigD
VATDKLKVYKEKRDSSITSGPTGGGQEHPGAMAFVIQKHWVRRLH